MKKTEVSKGRHRGVTCAQLDDAIAAACEAMVTGCSARNTLESLYALTEGASGAAVRLKGAPPVSVVQFDEALAEARECDLSARTLAALTRLRPLLVEAEFKTTNEGYAPVTRAEFESAQAATALALVVLAHMLHEPTSGPLDRRLAAAAQAAEFESAAAGIRALLDRFGKARSAEDLRQRRRASSRLHVVNGGGGCNF